MSSIPINSFTFCFVEHVWPMTPWSGAAPGAFVPSELTGSFINSSSSFLVSTCRDLYRFSCSTADMAPKLPNYIGSCPINAHNKITLIDWLTYSSGIHNKRNMRQIVSATFSAPYALLPEGILCKNKKGICSADLSNVFWFMKYFIWSETTHVLDINMEFNWGILVYITALVGNVAPDEEGEWSSC